MPMAELDFESDAFLTLLTDALRSGPGSPTWHDAVRMLRSGGISYADEYQLLVTAREHLESGKEYRSVRAGPGFTQRLMSQLEQESTTLLRNTPMTTAVAAGSAALMVLVLISIGYLLWTATDRGGVNDGSTLLTNQVTQLLPAKTLPNQWQAIGALGVESDRGGLKIGPGMDPAPTGGGAYWTQPIDPNEPFSLVASVKVYHFEDDVVTQIFITDQPEFAKDNATTPHELVWLLKSDQLQVIAPSGRIESQTTIPADARGDIVFSSRITIDRDQASVDVTDKRLWSGQVALDPAKPRYVGIRFLRRGTTKADGVVIQSLRVDMRQK